MQMNAIELEAHKKNQMVLLYASIHSAGRYTQWIINIAYWIIQKVVNLVEWFN